MEIAINKVSIATDCSNGASGCVDPTDVGFDGGEDGVIFSYCATCQQNANVQAALKNLYFCSGYSLPITKLAETCDIGREDISVNMAARAALSAGTATVAVSHTAYLYANDPVVGDAMYRIPEACRDCFDFAANMISNSYYAACLSSLTGPEEDCADDVLDNNKVVNYIDFCLGDTVVLSFTSDDDHECSAAEEKAIWDRIQYGKFLRCVNDDGAFLSDVELRYCIFDLVRDLGDFGCRACVLDLTVQLSQTSGSYNSYTGTITNKFSDNLWNAKGASYESCLGYSDGRRPFSLPTKLCLHDSAPTLTITGTDLLEFLLRCAAAGDIIRNCSYFRSAVDGVAKDVYDYVAYSTETADINCGNCYDDVIEGYLARVSIVNIDSCFPAGAFNPTNAGCPVPLSSAIDRFNQCNGKYDIETGMKFCTYFDELYTPYGAMVRYGKTIVGQSPTEQEVLDGISALVETLFRTRLGVTPPTFADAVYTDGVVPENPLLGGLVACASCFTAFAVEFTQAVPEDFAGPCDFNPYHSDCLDDVAVDSALENFEICSGIAMNTNRPICQMPTNIRHLSIEPMIRCAFAQSVPEYADYQTCFNTLFGTGLADAYVASGCGDLFYSFADALDNAFEEDSALVAFCVNSPFNEDCWNAIAESAFMTAFIEQTGSEGFRFNNYSLSECEDLSEIDWFSASADSPHLIAGFQEVLFSDGGSTVRADVNAALGAFADLKKSSEWTCNRCGEDFIRGVYAHLDSVDPDTWFNLVDLASALSRFGAIVEAHQLDEVPCTFCYELFIRALFEFPVDDRIDCSRNFDGTACQALVAEILEAFRDCADFRFQVTPALSSEADAVAPTTVPRPDHLTTTTTSQLSETFTTTSPESTTTLTTSDTTTDVPPTKGIPQMLALSPLILFLSLG